MSRIGKKQTILPSGVTVTTADGVLTVAGPKGTLTRPLHKLVSVQVTDGVATVSVQNEGDKKERALWGTFSSHLANMVEGVTTGFKKQLEVNGVGYRVAMQGADLKIEVGYSHPVIYKLISDVRCILQSRTRFDKSLTSVVADWQCSDQVEQAT